MIFFLEYKNFKNFIKINEQADNFDPKKYLREIYRMGAISSDVYYEVEQDEDLLNCQSKRDVLEFLDDCGGISSNIYEDLMDELNEGYKKFEGKQLSMFEENKPVCIYVSCTAFIDDEEELFKDAYKVLVKENKELRGKDMTVFCYVDADFSSGAQCFTIKNGKAKLASEKVFDNFINELREMGLKSMKDLKESDKVNFYHIDL